MGTLLNKATHGSRINQPRSDQGVGKKSGFKLKCYDKLLEGSSFFLLLYMYLFACLSEDS